MKLTGKTRYTTLNRLFRKPLLILEVEEIYEKVEDYGVSAQPAKHSRWRPATVEDLIIVLVEMKR